MENVEVNKPIILTNYKLSNGMMSRLIGLLSTSVLAENDRQEMLDRIPTLYTGEAQELHEYLMENQLCKVTQLAQFSNKGVKERLDEVMLNEKL